MRASDNVVVESNEAWAQLTGYARGEMVEQTALQLVCTFSRLYSGKTGKPYMGRQRPRFA
ncbi:MAG: hypothetical protein ACD_75C02619G0003 [uncultured bacterium]|nr:MAG: hypothetical protein ACD_75C02619G0003 [uncultured bacterium]